MWAFVLPVAPEIKSILSAVVIPCIVRVQGWTNSNTSYSQDFCLKPLKNVLWKLLKKQSTIFQVPPSQIMLAQYFKAVNRSRCHPSLPPTLHHALADTKWREQQSFEWFICHFCGVAATAKLLPCYVTAVIYTQASNMDCLVLYTISGSCDAEITMQSHNLNNEAPVMEEALLWQQ